MLKINAPSSNIFTDKESYPMSNQNLEKLQMTRADLAKRILRKKTDRGTEVAIHLNHGVTLHHGDLLEDIDNKILVEQLPEKVLCIKLKTLTDTNISIMLGHIIGNLHRPISINNDTVYFPIQADSEYDTFVRLFRDMAPHIEITVQEKIFHPHAGADIHGH